MQVILLSGGSGTRLWPLSNEARSKQFLRLLPKDGAAELESMVQRVVRQLREAKIDANLTIATSSSQKDSVLSQLGKEVNIVTEPSRRDTFPAICLATEYLRLKEGCSPDEVVVVMPCDPFTEDGFFKSIKEMVASIEKGLVNLMIMGIKPTYPSSKYGYIIPKGEKGGIKLVEKFVEKPDSTTAKRMISEGALWNGGVFAFKLGYLNDISREYVSHNSFEEIQNSYNQFPKISFDYQVAEKERSIGMIPFYGYWKDLGTWNTLTDELKDFTFGNVITDGTSLNSHILNELNLPLVCLGTRDLIIAASPDGILISEKSKSENIKEYANGLKQRPMYEERRWGKYMVIDHTESEDGYKSLTKRLTLTPGASISYQRHSLRNEVWTIVDGEGEVVIGKERKKICRGATISIPKGTMHSLRAITPLTFIEVQSGTELVEEDIERFPYEW